MKSARSPFSKIQLIKISSENGDSLFEIEYARILPKKKYKSVMNEHSHKFSNALYLNCQLQKYHGLSKARSLILIKVKFMNYVGNFLCC